MAQQQPLIEQIEINIRSLSGAEHFYPNATKQSIQHRHCDENAVAATRKTVRFNFRPSVPSR
jgi:hypothetical protein